MTTEYRSTKHVTHRQDATHFDDREGQSGAAMIEYRAGRSGSGDELKTIKGGNPMKIGDQGYLIEVGMKGIREDKWLKPPLYELIEIQKGFKVTHYVFRSIKGGYKRTMMDRDFNLGEWAFTDNPEPILRSEQPRLKARIGDISKHSYLNKFNKGGFPS